MKKLLALVLLLTLLCGAAMAEGAWTLVETPLFSPEQTYRWRTSAQFLKDSGVEALPEGAETTADGLYVEMRVPGTAFADATPVGVSPDGQTTVLIMGAYVLTLRDDVVTLLAPNRTRGVADEYGDFERFIGTADKIRYFGSEGLIWSPDGRYFVMTNWKQSLMYALAVFDLILYDTQMNECFLAVTYANAMRKENCGFIPQARFDETGEYLYFCEFGNVYAQRIALVRYEMATGVCQLIHTSANFIAQPMLCLMPNGRYINLLDVTRANEYAGFNLYSPDAAWRYEKINYPVPMMTALRSQYMALSSKTGNGVVLQRVSPYAVEEERMGICYWLTALDASEKLTGHDEFALIDSLDAAGAVRVKMTDCFDAEGRRLEGVGSVDVLTASLSPEDDDALLLLQSGEEYAFALMNLDTLALHAVDAPLVARSAWAGFDNPMPSFKPGMQWLPGHRVIIGTAEGAKVYALTEE